MTIVPQNAQLTMTTYDDGICCVMCCIRIKLHPEKKWNLFFSPEYVISLSSNETPCELKGKTDDSRNNRERESKRAWKRQKWRLNFSKDQTMRRRDWSHSYWKWVYSLLRGVRWHMHFSKRHLMDSGDIQNNNTTGFACSFCFIPKNMTRSQFEPHIGGFWWNVYEVCEKLTTTKGRHNRHHLSLSFSVIVIYELRFGSPILVVRTAR